MIALGDVRAFLAFWLPRASLFMTGLGIVLAAAYWWQLTTTGGSPVDARWYWSADPANLYPNPELGERNGYNYSPAFELVAGWGRLLPLEVFVALWRAMLLAALVWLAGPFTVPVLFTVPVASEINAGNIQLLLALAVVAGFRWPAAWAFVILTKVSPGLALAWFVLQRRWRALAVALGATGAIAVVAVALWPDRWAGYLQLLGGHPAPSVWPWHLTFWDRLPWAIGILVVGAWRGWRWPVVVAATVALPVFYALSPSMLVGVLPFLRESTGRWVRTVAATSPAGKPPEVVPWAAAEPLPRQPVSGDDAILAP